MFEIGKTLDLGAIKNILPQRPPMLMLDRAYVEDSNRFVAVKNLSINEPFFQGHFPGHPIMPGVLQLEAIKQLGELAVRSELDPTGDGDVYLWKVDKVKFRNPNLPGDRVKICVTVESLTDTEAVISGTTENSTGLTCEAKFTLKVRAKNVPDKMPKLFNEYDRSIGYLKDIHEVLNVIPHRFPFILLDGVVKMGEDTAITVKNVTGNEAMLLHTEDDYAILPESILCEILAQAGCGCVLARPENKGKLGLFAAIINSESFRAVFPGDQLVVDFDLPPAKKAFGKGTGRIFVDGELVFSSSIMFALVDPEQN